MNREKRLHIALLRGINVGGSHKVPMAELRTTFEEMGFTNIQTLLNSGNVIFEADAGEKPILEDNIALRLEDTFGFSIPVLVRPAREIRQLIEKDPFQNIDIHKNIRLYVTFVKDNPNGKLNLPWNSTDGTFRIITAENKSVCSVLDISHIKTTDAMNILEKTYGKDITTRNWNTILKIAGKF
jgi:uncharacterized protein (DUF1697 family)